MNAMSDIPVADRVSLGMAVIDDAWSRGAEEEALADATQLAEKVAPTNGPFFTVYAYLYLGIAQQQVGDWARAERALRNGLAALPASGDLNSMQPRLRRPLADVLAKQGRAPEDDSVRALDPVLAAMPKCTPGGDWRGCPG